MLFGGTADNGIHGDPFGILYELMDALGDGIHNGDPIVTLQYVKFRGSDSSYVWLSEHDYYTSPDVVYSVRYGDWYLSSIHTRLFRDPYKTAGGSYAYHNSVSAIHHEHWIIYDHAIDEDWETTEDNYLYTLSLFVGNTWWNDNLYNAVASQQGWFSNAYMGKMTLYHSNY